MTERELFEAALELPPENRAAFLDGVCAGDGTLRQRLEALLRQHDQAGSFLEAPAAPALAALGATPALPRITEGPSTVIGPYKLLQHLGEGGMGAVFMAEQTEPVRRMVALKIIKPGMDSAQVIARFEAERQALALMDHPHIARVFDAGTTESGRPYFVMELVKGIPITRFCDEHQLTPRERLELFVPVCQAVQHAHQKGIIHRDLKPSNVLVALYDDQPVVKVIDFGVAKATGEKLTERTLFTALGSFVGTLEYMSPEQAKLNALDIDTRSDVYALGVLLYELLTGSTPLERGRLKEAALDEVLRVIREEEPPAPSTRLSQSGAALAAISAQRKTEPARLGKVLRGELDWIVMKALEKDRSRRYETATGLARDVEHYLKDEAVEACPPSAGYRLRKFARKHRAGLLVTAGMAALLLAGIVVSAWQALRATTAEHEARGAEADARASATRAQESEATAREESARAKTAQAQLRRTLYASRSNAIQTAWEANSLKRVLDLLEQQRPGPGEADLRGFEWHYFNRLCHADLRTFNFGTMAVPSPDGARCAAFFPSDEEKLRAVKVWDLATGKEMRSWPIGPQDPSVLGFSNDGKRLAMGARNPTTNPNWDGRLVVWDIPSGKELFAVNDFWLLSLALSPDGGRVAGQAGLFVGDVRGDKVGTRANSNGALKVWDVATGKELAVLEDGKTLDDLVFSPDGSRLAGCCFLNGIFVWDATTGKTQLRIRPDNLVNGVAFSPDGTRLVASSQVGFSKEQRNVGALVFDAATGKELVAIQAPVMGELVFSHDGQRLAGHSATVNGSVVWVFDAATGKERLTLKGHTASISGMAFSPDDKRLYTSDRDGTVKVWDVTLDEPRQQPVVTDSTQIIRSPDGSREAVYTRPTLENRNPPSDVIIRDLAGKELLRFKEHTAAVYWLRFSRDGRYVVSAGGGEKKVWDPATGRVFLSQTATPFYLWPDTKRPVGGRVSISRLSEDNIIGVVVSADDSRVAEFGLDGVRVWDLTGPKEVFAFMGRSDRVECSPDLRRLVTLDSGAYRRPASPRRGPFDTAEEKPPREDRLRLWDVATGKEILTLQGTFSDLAFSPDGRLVAAVKYREGYSSRLPTPGKQVSVWDARTGAELATLASDTSFGRSGGPPGSPVGALAFSPDGSLASIVSPYGRPGEVLLWDIATGKERFRLKGHFGEVENVVFSPDGQRIATGTGRMSPDQEVKLWDAATGNELLTLKAANARRSPNVVSRSNLFFSPDGARLTMQGGHDFDPSSSRQGNWLQAWDATPLAEQR
jgi:WD40 repeat protein/serine/threonine protein kinase